MIVEERPRRKELARARRDGGRVGRGQAGEVETLEGGPLEPTAVPLGSGSSSPLRAFRLNERFEKTVASSWTLPPRSGLLILNVNGALAIRPEGRRRGDVIPAGSAWIGMAHRFHVRAAKGAHGLYLLTWPLALTPMLEALWLAAGRRDCGAGRSLQLGLSGAAERLALTLEAPEASSVLAALGVIYEVAAAVRLTGASEPMASTMRLTPWPAEMTPAIAEIATILREEAGANWNLRRAAARAGYSPHHFSRLFKATFGFGFQGYLERVRMESAISMLQTTDADVATIAARSELGSPAKLREALRNFVGFTPNDLRNIGI